MLTRVGRVPAEPYERMKSLALRTNGNLQFHMAEALNNYLNDVAPIYIAKAEEAKKEISKRRKN